MLEIFCNKGVNRVNKGVLKNPKKIILQAGILGVKATPSSVVRLL